jgi:dienelactone hydrolase
MFDRIMQARLRCVAIAAALGLTLQVQAATPLLPADAFFQDPEIDGASMSPDGTRVAILAGAKGKRPGIVIVDLANMSPRMVARYPNADVSAVWWLTDQRLAFSVANITTGAAYQSGLYSIGADGKDVRGLDVTVPKQRSFVDAGCGSCVREEGAGIHADFVPGFEYVYARVLWEDKSDGVARISTRNGEQQRVQIPRASYQWLFDAEQNARVAMSRSQDEVVMHYREPKGDWRKVTSFVPGSASAFMPDTFINNTLYVVSNKGGEFQAVYRYDLDKAGMAPEPFVASPEFDVNPYWVTNGKKPLGMHLTVDTAQTYWLDPAMKQLQEAIDAALPNTVNQISRGVRSQTPFVLVHAFSAARPSTYFVWNAETKKLTQLGESHPRIEPPRMAGKEFIRYKARDGMQIPAYVTLPPGATGKNLPTVVLVGDNPWERNGSWTWKASVQFLASRGYAVIEPDARGARGFGKRHHQAGIRQWGLGMQDDLADGARWAVAQGIADPKRICIVGGSYGGYAAMMGVIKDPDVFRCAVSWSGITDLAGMFKPRWESRVTVQDTRALAALVGDPTADRKEFMDRSPLHQAARIKAPVLLANGVEDIHVRSLDGEALAEAIRAGGNQNVEFHLYDQKGQQPISENRLDLWTRIEKFLEKHNGPQL